jgi:hypothetical protein
MSNPCDAIPRIGKDSLHPSQEHTRIYCGMIDCRFSYAVAVWDALRSSNLRIEPS